MRRQWSIRARVAITIGLLGLALGSTFSYTLMQTAERYEHIILRTVLSAEADAARADIADGLIPRMPETRHLEGWLVPDMNSPRLPEALRGLRPGIHEYRSDDGEEPHVGVFEVDEGMLVYRIDIGQIEELEEALQFWIRMLVLLSAGVTTAIGWWLAGRALGPVDAAWRGLGVLPRSGLEPRPEFAAWDARVKHQAVLQDMDTGLDGDPPGCRCAEVMTGRLEPEACPLFGAACRPDTPVGACMVGSEGTCRTRWLWRED